MKKILALILALVMILALAACGNTAPAPAPAAAPAEQQSEETAPADTAEEPAKPVKIGYITSDPSSGFWKEVLESFQNACSEEGVELVYQIASDSAGMRSAYDSLLAQEVDIIVDGYSIEEIANAYAEEAVDTGMPFMAVAFNCPVEGAYSYGTSNDGMGVSFGEFAAESVKKEWDGQIDLIVTANAYTAVPAMASRTDKAVETLLETPGFEYLKDVEWVKIDTGLDTSTIGANTANTILSHPDAEHIVYIVCTDAFCPTIVNALADSGASDKVLMLSSDCTSTYIDYAKAAAASDEWSPWYGSLDLQTATYGNKLLAKALAILNGENPEAYTEHSGVMVTKYNINDFYG